LDNNNLKKYDVFAKYTQKLKPSYIHWCDT